MKKMYLLMAGLLLSGVLLAQKKPKNTPAPAPTVQKRALTHNDYDGWRSIGARSITANGDYAVYSLSPQEGDATLVVQSLKQVKLDSFQRAAEARVNFEGSLLAFKIKPAFKLNQDLKRQKKKKDEMPKDTLGIYSFANNSLAKIPHVQSYKFPEKAGGLLAYLLDVPPVVKKTESKSDSTKKPETPRPSAPRGKAPKKESDESGYKLVVKSLKNNTERTYAFVTEYEWAKNGKYLSFVTTGNDSTMKPGVYVVNPEKDELTQVFEGRNKQKFKKLTFSEAGEHLAFVADLDTNAKTQIRLPKLYLWRSGQAKAALAADESTQPGPKGWLVSAEAAPFFAKDASKLFFGTNPKPVVQDTTLLAEEIVNVEVWNYQDVRLQTQQKATLEADKKRSYWAVMNLSDGSMTQLGSPSLPQITPVNEGRADFVLAESDVAYSNQHWDWNPKQDVYLVSTKDGARKQIGKYVRGNAQVSPEGKYVYWFSLPDTAWYAYSVAKDKTVRLTKDRRFADEDDDHPDYPNAYGMAGWTKGDERVWLYDKFDVWAVNPETGEAENLTQTGRKEQKEYRYVRLDPEERSIDPSKPVMLRMFNHQSKGSGYYELAATSKQLSKLFEGDFNVQAQVLKARNTNDILFSKTTFREFPDVWHADLKFSNPRKLSNLDAQVNRFSWGTVELVNYKSADGVPLQGLLFKPDNFDPTKQYPMLTYFYEKNSDNLHNFVTPSPNGSAYTNYSYAVSNGYVVFVPDIVYKVGFPGQSAYSCIMPGVLSILDKGFVDRNNIGIVGHSWGGYQTAYLITQTNLFKTAVPGAPVANMTSAYGGIRWGTGLSRQAQYESTQTRIGGNLWQKTQNYLDNSPLFYLDQVQTPALILHNDDDDAVPWYQGIELFMGLKRLNKPVWMLNYNGEKHGNRQRKNQKDFSMRMWQYLDHFLKGAPMPSWMAEGLPMVEKGINQHLEPAKNTGGSKMQSGSEK